MPVHLATSTNTFALLCNILKNSFFRNKCNQLQFNLVVRSSYKKDMKGGLIHLVLFSTSFSLFDYM